MTKEELKDYLRENMKIEFYPEESCCSSYLGIRITLEGEEICRDWSSIKNYD